MKATFFSFFKGLHRGDFYKFVASNDNKDTGFQREKRVSKYDQNPLNDWWMRSINGNTLNIYLLYLLQWKTAVLLPILTVAFKRFLGV